MGVRQIIIGFFLGFALLSAPRSLAASQDFSSQGQDALSRYDWKSSETEHFVYYFTDPKDAEVIISVTEKYYSWVKKIIGVSEDAWQNKAPVFIFPDKEVWQEFRGKTAPHLSGEAYTNGSELFLF